MQLNITTDHRKEMVSNGGWLADLKMLDVTHLFECPMIPLDLLVLVMELEKGRTINSVPLFVIRWIQGIMAWLVFQPLPKHLDHPESLGGLSLWRVSGQCAYCSVGRPALIR